MSQPRLKHRPTALYHCAIATARTIVLVWPNIPYRNMHGAYYRKIIQTDNNWIFMPPRSKIGGHIVFVLPVILSFCPPLWNFNLANNFWTVSARALIFHMHIPCDKTFPWVSIIFTLWPWPWSLIHFLKTLRLLITFEQWVLELWYFTWLFLVIRLFRGFIIFWQCDLDLGV